MTDSEMLEKRCHAWEKTRQRGQFLYAIFRGVALGCFWFLINTLLNVIDKRMSYAGIAVVSFCFFIVGYSGASKAWRKAENRYESDKQYLESMR
jgi:hypothetical protein